MQNPMMIRIVAAGLAAILLAAAAGAAELKTAAPDKVGFSKDRLARVSRFLQRYVDEEKLAGSAVLIIRDGQVVLNEAVGFRDLESKAKMEKDAIFRIASQTKAVVSVGVMILQEQGRLLIGDRLGKYLPEYQKTTVAVPKQGGGYEVVPARRPITIRDLLTHTAGIGYGGGLAAEAWAAEKIQGWYFAHQEEPIRETVRRMAALPMVSHPGQRWVYGYSTDILGALIEEVSGQPLDKFLAQHVFDPLDMRDTHFYLPASKRNRLATVYSVGQDRALKRTPDASAMVGQGAYVDGPRRSFSGGAGLLSTTRDYGRFLQMMANGGELDGKRILSRNTVKLMTVDHLNGLDFRPGQGFGLGFYVNVDRGARGIPGDPGEYGWGGAYHTTYFVDPIERLVVVYMTQLMPAGGLDDAGKLRALVYQAIEY